MAAKRKYRSTNEYLKYLKGELTSEERYSFERELEADPFEMEAMEGMERLSDSELEEDLLTLHAHMQKRLNRRKRRTWYYAAATIASLLIVGTVFLNIYDIDPKTASETIPGDESFMHEEAVPQMEIAEAKKDKVVKEVVEREMPDRSEAAAEKTEAYVADADVADADVMEFKEQEAEPAEVEQAMAMEAAEEAVDHELINDRALDKEISAPVPANREVVAMEARPKRSQKKGRVLEAPVEAPLEAPMEAPASYAGGRVQGIVVSSEDMEPLPGASIVVKGSDSGMVTDMDGRFAFVSDKQEPATVIASFVGMETEEYQLTGESENRLVMQPDLATLNEVVVVGYDADRQINQTGAVQRVKLDQEELIYSGAEPEGGLDAFKMYIEEQIRFPAGDTISKREVVVLKFHVARDGAISDIQTLRSPGKLFSDEAIRLLQEGPRWNPARNESGITDDVVRMRVVFKR